MVTVPTEEISFAKLRDCFTGGYTFPQFCIDNGIKKPLFISEQKFMLFMWEIYVQFYNTPPRYIADMVYRRNSSKAA